jgi:hypothetical protein
VRRQAQELAEARRQGGISEIFMAEAGALRRNLEKGLLINC